MKVAFISPIKHLLDLPETGYDMVLAGHLRNEVYRRFHSPEARRYRPSGHITILDNGAAEEGCLSVAELGLYIRHLQPDIFIVPDDMSSAKNTAKMSRRWVNSNAWRECVEELGKKAPGLMVVPHGCTLQEWTWCLYELMQLKPRPRYVGIAKIHTNMADVSPIEGRAPLVRRVCNRYPEVDIHLLGLAGSPAELVVIDALQPRFSDRVLGVDTALPWVLASHHQVLDLSGYFVRPPEWHSDESETFNPTQVKVAKFNADTILDLAGAER